MVTANFNHSASDGDSGDYDDSILAKAARKKRSNNLNTHSDKVEQPPAVTERAKNLGQQQEINRRSLLKLGIVGAAGSGLTVIGGHLITKAYSPDIVEAKDGEPIVIENVPVGDHVCRVVVYFRNTGSKDVKGKEIFRPILSVQVEAFKPYQYDLHFSAEPRQKGSEAYLETSVSGASDMEALRENLGLAADVSAEEAATRLAPYALRGLGQYEALSEKSKKSPEEIRSIARDIICLAVKNQHTQMIDSLMAEGPQEVTE